LLWFLRQHVATEAADSDRSTPASSDRLDYRIERQRHAGFLGRDAQLARLDRLLIEDEADHWVVVTGGPGMGKSAILTAWLSRREAAGAVVPHHFIRRGEGGWDEPAKIVASLSAQIEACFPAQRDPEARPESRLADLLARVATHELAPRGDHLVLLIDGLDEYDAPASAYNPLAAFLPQALPRVRLLCASRPRHPNHEALEARGGVLIEIDLDDPSAATDNDAIVRAFWRREAAALGLDEQFVDEAVASARGNMQHAVTLRKHLASVPPEQRRVEAIPRGLKALLALLWRRVTNNPVATRGLGVLCAAREPLSLDELGAVARWEDAAQREAFRHAALEFLVETRRDDGTAEYRLHHDSIRAHAMDQLGPAVVRDHHAAMAQELATWPAPADAASRRYALRHALTHRAEAGDWPAVGKLALDVGFLEAKCRELGVQDVEADVARATERCRALGDAAIGRDLQTLARAVARESHWLHDEPAALAGQLWNRLRRMGWSAEDLDRRVRWPADAPAFLRVRHVASRESPALLRDLVGHSSGVYACAITPDGSRVVSAAEDETLEIWDLDTGRALMTLEGHTNWVRDCTVTPDGGRVISASADETLKVWDLNTGRVLMTLEGHTGWVNGCAVTPDGGRVISASTDGTLKIWNLATGRCLATLEHHIDEVISCAVIAGGERVASASGDGTIKVWDLGTGFLRTTIEAHVDGVYTCTVSPDGRRAVSTAQDGILKVWDLETARLLLTIEAHAEAVNRCAVTFDGRRVISTSDDHTLKIWDLETGRLLATLAGHAETVNACAVTRDDRYLVSAAHDRTLKVWDLEASRGATTGEGHAERVDSCAMTPDGQRVISASYDGTLKLWDVETGRLIKTFEGHTSWVNGCAVTPDGRRMISASMDDTLKVWDLRTGRLIKTLKGHTATVSSCAVTPDGRRVVSVSEDRTFRIWNLVTGHLVKTLKHDGDWVGSGALTPDGQRVVSTSSDPTLKVWDLATGRLVKTLEGHTDVVNRCAVTLDGRRVVSASRDWTLRVWDLATGRSVKTLEGHTDQVHGCAMTPDGRHVISVSDDRTFKIWDLTTYECLATHRGDTGFSAAAATATVICAGDAAGALWFLDRGPGQAKRSPP
jgi:WD40 repeat protein